MKNIQWIYFLYAEKLGLGQKAKLLFEFKNPLPVAMNDVTLNIDMDGMKEGERSKYYYMAPLLLI